jgi:hypothetical protein
MRPPSALLPLSFLTTLAMACAPGDSLPSEESSSENTDALSSGVNGAACVASPYNCKLRENGGNAVDNAQGGLWAVEPDDVVDGDGHVMGKSSFAHLRFNYGQTRRMNDRTYVYARSTSVGSSGWFPIDKVVSESALRDRVGEVNAHGAGLAKMACYAVKSSHDPALVELKVVYDSKSDNERAGDYLPLVRGNGQRYANLAFNVPGFGLGGPAVDIFPAGAKFQRLDVATDGGKPSIDVPLYSKDAAGHYKAPAGTLKFVYGYFVSGADGAKRYGWMAYPALEKSSGCP